MMRSARRNLLILSISSSIGLFLIVELAHLANRWDNNLLPSLIEQTNGSSSVRAITRNTFPLKKIMREDDEAVKWQTNGYRKTGNLSILGEWLRAPEGTPPPAETHQRYHQNKRLLILVWKYGPFLERRHILHSVTAANYSESSSSWMRGCSVRKCQLTYHDEDLSRADAVIFHLHLTKGIDELPSTKSKPAGQIWIFMTDESPLNTFMYTSETGNQDISVYDGTFDWSMTYREDSDVPVAYGRTVKKQRMKIRRQGERREKERDDPDDDDRWIKARASSLKKKLVAIMGSNCSSGKNQRWKYVRELKMLLGERLDIYGKCLGGNRTACPGHFHRDCPILSSYKFYLAFENSNCREYITEKVYWNAYEKRSVPIIMGAPRIDCQKLLPPRSFIHVDDFAAPTNLVDYIRYLDDNDDSYGEYHKWRSRYRVINEHGYFGSVSRHYCRVCEALHYNTSPAPTSFHRAAKYRQIGRYWNSTRDCHPH